jgi:hypothetical protein
MDDDFARGLSDLRERFEQGRSTVKEAVTQHVSAIDEAIGALHDIRRTFQACGTTASEEEVKARLQEVRWCMMITLLLSRSSQHVITPHAHRSSTSCRPWAATR